MGKVNVVREDGSVVAVDEETYLASQQADKPRSRAEATVAAIERLTEEEAIKRNTGLAQSVGAVGFGVADMLTAGALGKGIQAVGDDRDDKNFRAFMKANKREAQVGNVLGVFTGTGLPGLAAKASTKIATQTGSKALGRAAEGVLLGAGGRIATTNITGDPLSVESLLLDMGTGALLNVGFGAVADKISNVKAAKPTGPTTELNWTPVTGKNPAPMARAERARLKAEEAIEAEKAANFAALERADSVADADALALLAQSKKAAEVAKKQAATELKAAKQLLDESPAYASFRESYTTANANARRINTQVEKEAQAYAKFVSPAGIDKTVSAYEKVQAQIRERMQKAARGGSMDADVDLARMTDLQDSLSQISVMKRAAKEAAREGNYELAAAAIRDTESKIARVLKDIPLPALPPRPGKLVPVGPELPKSLTELGAKQADTIAKLSNSIDDLSKAELDKVAAELGLAPGEVAGDVLGTLHRQMRQRFYTKVDDLAKEADEFVPFRRFDEVVEKEASLVNPLKEAADKAKLEAADAAIMASRAEGGYQELQGLRVVGGGRGAAGRVGKAADEADGLLDGPIDWAKKGIRYAAGRSVDSGGLKGAFFRTMVGGATGAAIDGVDGFLVGSAVASGRLGARARIREAFVKYGKPAGQVIERMGPVTTILKTQFPSGQPDDEEDERKLTVNRINDVLKATQAAPDVMYQMVKPLMGQDGDLAYKMYSKTVEGLRYLAATAPKDPGIDITATGSQWTPSWREADEFSHRFEATLNPMGYLVRTLNGDGHAAGVEALAYNWPAILGEALAEATMQDWSDLSLEQHRGLSMLFQTSASGLQHPSVVTAIQGQFLPRQDVQGGGGQPGPSGPPGVPGRPPAVHSTIAGSNVAGLIS